jgi:hypothetical protein
MESRLTRQTQITEGARTAWMLKSGALPLFLRLFREFAPIVNSGRVADGYQPTD